MGYLITTWQILDSSKLKEFADDNFKFDENVRKLSKRVENTVRKGEIARYEQFLLFPQCLQKACVPGASKGVIGWEWVKQEIAWFVMSEEWYRRTEKSPLITRLHFLTYLRLHDNFVDN